MATNNPRNTPLDEAALEAAAAGEHWGPQRVTRGRRDVVTGFVRKPVESTVLLVKRSEKVNTYKLHWGGVSGVVEGDENLQQRAEREIFEEVGYDSTQINFIRSGRPLYVDDKSGKLFLAVHPFLFDLLPNANNISPKLNWENVDAQFMPFDSLKTLQPCVPQLADTLDRVLMSPFEEVFIEKLKKDRDHGAAQLAVWVLDALEQEIQRFREEKNRNLGFNKDEENDVENDNGDGPGVLEHLRNYGYHLSTCRPSMTPLATTTARVLSSLHQSLHKMASPFSITVDEVCLVALHAVQKERDQLATRAARLLSHALELLHDNMTIMTISKSSSVSAVVHAALKQGRKLKIIICESRPLCEGVVSAQSWADAGAEVTVITDAQAGVFMKHVDLVLIGVDAVDAEHGVYNKVGTRLLALAAKEAHVPVYAIADSSKISPGPLEKLAHPGEALSEDLGEEKDAEEVVQGWLKSGGEKINSATFSVRNVYFEATPLELMTAVVTENGVMDAEAIKEEIERIKEVYIEAFQLQI